MIQKIAKEGTLPNSFYEAIITLIPKAEDNSKKKKKLQANISDEHRYKNPQYNINKPNLAIKTIKRTIYYDQLGFIPGMQGFLNICKSISVIYHTNKLKNKNHMTT